MSGRRWARTRPFSPAQRLKCGHSCMRTRSGSRPTCPDRHTGSQSLFPPGAPGTPPATQAPESGNPCGAGPPKPSATRRGWPPQRLSLRGRDWMRTIHPPRPAHWFPVFVPSRGSRDPTSHTGPRGWEPVRRRSPKPSAHKRGQPPQRLSLRGRERLRTFANRRSVCPKRAFAPRPAGR
jgi:hypothetical protein